MTEREIAIAIAFQRVTFLPASSQKRFAKAMTAQAQNAPEKPLSEKQRLFLTAIAWRFRRQMPAELAYPLNNDE